VGDEARKKEWQRSTSEAWISRIVGHRNRTWFKSNRGSQLRTHFCSLMQKCVFMHIFRYFMQKRRKYRSFGQKFRLYMRIFSVVEVESTFLTLFFCQKSRYFFIFFTSTKNAKKAVRTGFEQNLRIKLLFFVAAKTAQKCCLWWILLSKTQILRHSFEKTNKTFKSGTRTAETTAMLVLK